MHNVEMDFSIGIESLSKIEGHAELEVKVKKGKVADAKLLISENKRFFAEAVIGKHALAVPQTVARICGTCSVAHLLAAIEAVESAFALEPSEQTVNMRKLLMNGTHIRDHAMHLFLFCLPDYVGKDSILDFDEKQHDLIHKAFEIKAAGNNLATTIGGRAVHSPLPLVGGFLKTPKQEEVKKSIAELKKAREAVFDFMDVFCDSDFQLETDSYFVALSNDDYNYLTGEICSDEGKCIPEYAFGEYLDNVVIPYSQARGFTYKGQNYMVGALARMNYNKDKMHKDTKKDCSKYLKRFPSRNIFDNNVAQLIEIVHNIDASLEMLERMEFKAEPVQKAQIRQGVGLGVVEAPRGLLYYKVMTEADGKISYANLVIPTAQNQVKMEKDLGAIVQQNLDKGTERKKIANEMEKVIRAYDPCMSCATNFLKVKWNE